MQVPPRRKEEQDSKNHIWYVCGRFHGPEGVDEGHDGAEGNADAEGDSAVAESGFGGVDFERLGETRTEGA